MKVNPSKENISVSTLYIDLPHIRLAAKRWGEVNNPVVLCLHGWLDNAESFSLIAPYLCQNYQVIAIDWPGHGHSQHRPKHASYHFIDQVNDLILLVEHLPKKPVAVLAHSMGAAVASLAAGAFPELFQKLCLIDMLGPLSAEADDARTMLRRSIKRYQIERQRDTRYFDSFEQALQRRASVSSLPAELLTDLVKRNCQQQLLSEAESQTDDNQKQYAWCWSTDPRLKLPSSYRMTEEQVLNVLSHIQCPVSLIMSENTLQKNQQQYQKRMSVVNQLQLQVLNGDHHLHIEQPEAVAEMIIPFLYSE